MPLQALSQPPAAASFLYMRKQTCDRLIKHAVDDPRGVHLGAVAFWMRVQLLYKHPEIYNFTFKKAALQTGVSESSVRRYVRELKRLGYVQMKGTTLAFLGQEKAKELFDTKKIVHVELNKYASINEIKDALRLVIIRENQYIQSYVYSKRSKRKRHNEYERSSCKKAHMGIRHFGRLIGLKKSGAYSLMRRNVGKGISSRRFQILDTGIVPDSNISLIELNKLSRNTYIVRNGHLCIFKGTQYLFSV